MNDAPAAILILRQRIQPADLRRLVVDGFGDMVKFVADIERRTIAIGGELHADAELVLLEDGSRPSDLWGANTVELRPRAALGRELLRWRDLVAQLWLDPAGAPQLHQQSLRLLLRFSPTTAGQIPAVLGRPVSSR